MKILQYALCFEDMLLAATLNVLVICMFGKKLNHLIDWLTARHHRQVKVTGYQAAATA